MKPFSTVASVLFGLMALAHLYRIVKHFDLVVMGHPVPIAVNFVGVAIAGVLSVGLWREAKR